MTDRAGEPGQPGQPGEPGYPGTGGAGSGGAGGMGGRGGAGGAGAVPRARVALFAAAALALGLAGAGFGVALHQANDATVQAERLSAALAAEVRRHCVVDAGVKNRQRALDLAWLAADRAARGQLAAGLGRAVDPALVRAQIEFYGQAIRARVADLPAYQDPAKC